MVLPYINSTSSTYRIATCLEFCHRRLPVLIDLSCALSNKLERCCKICRGKYLSIVVWVWQFYERRQGKMLFYRANIWHVILHYSPSAHVNQMFQTFVSFSPTSHQFLQFFTHSFKKDEERPTQLKLENWRRIIREFSHFPHNRDENRNLNKWTRSGYMFSHILPKL